jgi:hypothetical protein
LLDYYDTVVKAALAPPPTWAEGSAASGRRSHTAASLKTRSHLFERNVPPARSRMTSGGLRVYLERVAH